MYIKIITMKNVHGIIKRLVLNMKKFSAIGFSIIFFSLKTVDVAMILHYNQNCY